jgi:hypothetical protein
MSTWQKSFSPQSTERESVAAATYLRAAEHGCPANPSFGLCPQMIAKPEIDRGRPGS